MGGTVDLNDLAGAQRSDLPGARTGPFAHCYRAIAATAVCANRERGGCRWQRTRRAGGHRWGDGRGDLRTRRGGCRTLAPDRRNAGTGLGSTVTPDGGYDSDSSNHNDQNHNRGDDQIPLPRPPGTRCRSGGRCGGRNDSRVGLGSGIGIRRERARAVRAEGRLLEGGNPIGVGVRGSHTGITRARRRVGPDIGWKQPLCFRVRLVGVVSGIRVARHGESYSPAALPRRRPRRVAVVHRRALLIDTLLDAARACAVRGV
jgi:hypothetical protein